MVKPRKDPVVEKASQQEKAVFKPPRSKNSASTAGGAPRKKLDVTSKAKPARNLHTVHADTSQHLPDLNAPDDSQLGAEILLDLEQDVRHSADAETPFYRSVFETYSTWSGQPLRESWGQDSQGAAPGSPCDEQVDIEESVNEVVELDSPAPDEEVVKGKTWAELLEGHRKLVEAYKAGTSEAGEAPKMHWTPFEGHFVLEQRHLHADEWRQMHCKASKNRYTKMHGWCSDAMAAAGGEWVRSADAIKAYLSRKETSVIRNRDAKKSGAAAKKSGAAANVIPVASLRSDMATTVRGGTGFHRKPSFSSKGHTSTHTASNI